MSLYPKASETKTYTDLPNDCASRIIDKLEAGETKAQMLAYCLNGSNNVPAFNALYDEIIAEAKALNAVSPANHETYNSYISALAAITNHLNANVWYSALLSAKGAENWSELKAMYEEV